MTTVKKVITLSPFEELQRKEKEIVIKRSEMISKMKEAVIEKIKKAFSVTHRNLPIKMPSASNEPDFFAIKFQDIPFSILVASNTHQFIVELFDTHTPEKYFNKKDERWSTVNLRANRPHLFRMEYFATEETFFDTQNPLHQADRYLQNTKVIRKLEDLLYKIYKEIQEG